MSRSLRFICISFYHVLFWLHIGGSKDGLPKSSVSVSCICAVNAESSIMLNSFEISELLIVMFFYKAFSYKRDKDTAGGVAKGHYNKVAEGFCAP